jgi:CubicO group peptidase (beta-lactamase class C family)
MIRSVAPQDVSLADRSSQATDGFEMETKIREILNRWPTVGLAVGIVRNGSLEFSSGHGPADIESRAPVTDQTVFRIGSVTKTFTAIAVMQLWEEGLIDLDAPANDYLRAYKLIPAKIELQASGTASSPDTHEWCP